MLSVAPLPRVKAAAGPARDSRLEPRGTLVLGKSPDDHKWHGRYVSEITSTIVLGQPGCGKTVFMLSQVYQHILKHDGVFVLDPHNDLVAKVLKTIPEEARDDVIYINPQTLYRYHRGAKLNLLSPGPGGDKSQVINLFVEAIRGLYKDYWTPEAEQAVKNLFLVLLAQPRTKLGDIVQFLTSRDTQEQFLKNVRDEGLVNFWKYHYTPSAQTAAILDGITAILKEDAVMKMFDCYESTIDLDTAISARKCILVALPEAGIASRAAVDFIGSLFLTKIYLAGMARSNKAPLYVYVDEAHKFTTSTTRDALAELRKFGVFFTFATQTLGQYDNSGGYAEGKTYKSVLDMCQTIIAFRTDKNTASELIPYFGSRYTIGDFINIPNHVFIARVPVNNAPEYANLESVMPRLKYDDADVIERSLSKYGQAIEGGIVQRPQIEQPFQEPQPEMTVAGLLVNDGKVLVIQSAKWSHKWTIPGGHIRTGETMYDAFRREIFEETGITVGSGELLYVDDLIAPPEYHRNAHFIVVVFKSQVARAEAFLNQEAYKYEWIPPGDAGKYDLAGWSLKAIQTIDDRRPIAIFK